MSTSGGRSAVPDPSDGPSGDDAPVTNIDGRTLRRRRNRDAVLKSLVDLIREGDLNPTIEKIADRAEVSARSIFRYFDDLNDLARSAIEGEIVAAMPLGIIPDRGEGDLPHRIDALIAARARLFSSVHLLFVVAHRRADDIDDVARGLQTAASMLLEQLKYQFREELNELDPDDAMALASSLSAGMSLEAWDLQRRYLGQSEDEVVHGWRVLLERALA